MTGTRAELDTQFAIRASQDEGLRRLLGKMLSSYPHFRARWASRYPRATSFVEHSSGSHHKP